MKKEDFHLDLPEFDYNEFLILDCQGKGEFGIVYKGFWIKQKKFVALKFVNVNYQDAHGSLGEKEVLDEISKFQDKYIPQYFGTFKDSRKFDSEGRIYLIFVMEIGEADLYKVLKIRKNYNQVEILAIVYDLAAGLLALKKGRICHGDVKLADVVVFKENNEKVYKFIDFGMSYIAGKNKEENLPRVKGMTRLYASPELKKICQYNEFVDFDPYQSDIYALGIIILKLVGLSNDEISELGGNINNLPQRTRNQFPELIPLIEKTLESDIKKRITVEKFIDALKQKKKIEKPVETAVIETINEKKLLKLTDEELEKYANIYGNLKEFQTMRVFIKRALDLHPAPERTEFWNGLLEKIKGF